MKYCSLIYSVESGNLKLCLESVLQQTIPSSTVYVCGDWTIREMERMANNRVVWLPSTKNITESYRAAFATILNTDVEFVWCVQDTAIPTHNAFGELMTCAGKNLNASFVSSLVYHKHTATLVPKVSEYNEDGKFKWANFAQYDMIRVTKTPMTSVLIRMKSVSKYGLPKKGQVSLEMSDYLDKLAGQCGAGYCSLKSVVTLLNPIEIKKANTSQNNQIVPKIKICAIVVTYNRKLLLMDCIRALLAQKDSKFDIYIIDNCSTDGTKETVSPLCSDRVKYFNTGNNLGGAGGFYYGIKKAYEDGYDWIWIMDDDVVPSATALKELVAAISIVKTSSFFASAVYSPKGQAMNTPEISHYSTNGYKFWYSYLDQGMVRLAHATFVSLLINRKAIEKCGLPCKDYFIWGDDTEYTMRLIGKYGAAYMVGKSKVVHNRGNSSTLSINVETNPNRIKMYYYMVRNTLINESTYHGSKAVKGWEKRYLKDCLKIAFSKQPYRKLKISTVLHGIYDWKTGRYDKLAFINRYSVYGQEKFVGNILCGSYTKDFVTDVSFTTIRTTHMPSMFSISKYIDTEVFKSIDAGKETAFQVLTEINAIDKNEYLIVDVDSLCKPICKIEYEGKKYFLDEGANLLDNNVDISLDIIDNYQLDKDEFEEQIISFISLILAKYRQEQIIIVKPKTRIAIKAYDFIIAKLPSCKKSLSVENAVNKLYL